MALGTLRREERIGLVIAVALHAALIGALLLRPTVNTPPAPQPISVTLSSETGLTATAPSHADAAADMAPKLGASSHEQAPAPVASPPPPRVEPMPVEKPLPSPRPVAVTQQRSEPQPKPLPIVRPKPEALAKPTPVEIARPRSVAPAHHPAKTEKQPEDTIGQAIAAAAPTHRHVDPVKDWSLAMPSTDDRKPAGGSRIGADFLKGVAGGKISGKAQVQGAAVLGPEERAALSGAIARQLKPHWVAPEGADADKLVTVLAWDLNRDGSLVGTPHVVSQSGITPSNRPQAARHAEMAIRAVVLAAPFQLPPQFYNVWKHVRSFEFNRKLSQ